MTCAVGLKANGRVYLGVDSAATNHIVQVTARSCSKLFRLGPLLITSAGSLRAPQIIRYCINDEVFTGIDRDPLRWMVREFAPMIRTVLSDHGSMDKYPEGSDKQDLTMLVAYRSRLFEVFEDFQVQEWRDGYHALGKGDEIALGVLFATKHLEPKVRVKMALTAAAKFQGNVRPPFLIEATEPKRVRQRGMQLVTTSRRKAG